MVDKTQRSYAAKNALADEILMRAVADVQDRINKELLNAKTPEEREIKWQEWHGIERAKQRLIVWASDAPNHEEVK